MEKFDLIIIGGGSGAFAAAIKANELGAKTAMINSELPLGGTCVNVGCVPSKTLLHIAEFAWRAKNNPPHGVTFDGVNVDFKAAVEHELSLVEKFRKEKYEDVVKSLENVTLIEGKAKFVGKNEVEVYPASPGGAGQKYSAEKFLISNGSTAVAPPIPGLDKVSYITHIDALQIKELPKRLVVLGGGPVALEFAQMYRHFGSHVTLLQRSQILREAEPEISRGLVEVFKDEGIEVYENLEFLEIKEVEGEKFVKVKMNQTSQETQVSGDVLLVGTGKKPNTEGLGLDVVGLETEKSGGIKVSQTMQTTATHVWAAGDVAAAPKRLETTAAKEGNIAADNALNNASRKMTYVDIPSVVFTTPAVASVGLTDEEANQTQGITCNCGTIPMSLVPKATIIGDTRGYIKMVINHNTKQILGVHILARDAGDLIHEGTLAVKFGLTKDQIIDTVHVFPTLSEATKLVATAFDKDISKLSCCIE